MIWAWTTRCPLCVLMCVLYVLMHVVLQMTSLSRHYTSTALFYVAGEPYTLYWPYTLKTLKKQ